MQVQELILHKILEEDRLFSLQLREQNLSVSDENEQMMLQLHQSYQSKAKGYGVFTEHSPFAKVLNQYLEQDIDFLTLSKKSAEFLVAEMSKYPFTQSGTLIVSRYKFLATDYLFFALIDNMQSILVDNNLDVQKTEYLALDNFDMVCRINITEMQNNAKSNRYLTFAKGRVGRKVADFFLDFLGAEIGLEPKVQNQVLMQAICDYTEQEELEKEQTLDMKKKALDYCKAKQKSGDEIILQELSDELGEVSEMNFNDFTHSKEYNLEESIVPAVATLKNLTKFSGAGRGVSISFDAELLGDRVVWDSENDTLTIKKLPPNLKDQLTKHS